MTAMHTSNRSASTSPGAQWTLSSAVDCSAPSSLLAAVVAAIIAVASTIDDRIPLTTGIVIAALLPAALVDLIDRRLPNRLVGAAALAGIATLVAELLVTDLQVALTDVLLGAAGLAGPLLVTHLVRPAAMGFGDVKLAVVLGAALGLVDPVLGLAALTIGSACAALVGMTLRRRTVAFGPGLLGGAILSVLLVISPLDPLDLDGRAVAVPMIVTPPNQDIPHPEGDQP